MIRKARKEDADTLATCLLQAMEEIVYHFIGIKDEVKAQAFLHQLVQGEANQYSYQNCFVAETEGRLIAAVAVYDGADLHRLRQPVLDFIKRQYGRTLQPEDETGPGEICIDSLGVLPACRGKGIGTQLLRFLVEKYVHRQNQTLGILVDVENPQTGACTCSLVLHRWVKKRCWAKRWCTSS